MAVEQPASSAQRDPSSARDREPAPRERTFPPDPAFTAQANAKADLYLEAETDFEAFWARLARERISWSSRSTRRSSGTCRSPAGSSAASSTSATTASIATSRTASAARSPTTGSASPATPGRSPTPTSTARSRRPPTRSLRWASAKGDRVAIYMPMIPELPIAMLACARIGAPHTVVFGGFSAEALAGRINDAEAKLVITADGGWRRGKPAALKPAVDEALESTPVGPGRARRAPPRRRRRRTRRWSRTATTGGTTSSTRSSPTVRAEPLDSEHMLYLLYTSGRRPSPRASSTPRPATCSGTSYTHEMIFDLKPDDVYWCAADIGWVTGHSYIVYGPLANATTGVMYEGTPDTPAWDRWWQIIEDYKVTILYCAPTAIRAFMKQGDEYPAKHDLSSLRVLGSVGEPINPEAWLWYHENIGGGKAPDRRHVVADRDRADPDHAAARRDDDQARQRHVPVPGHQGRRRRRQRRLRAARGWGIPRPEAALAGDAPRHLRRPGAVQGDVLEPLPGHVLRRRRREARRGRLLLAARPGRRRDERLRAIACRRPRSRARSSRTPRSPRRPSSAGPIPVTGEAIIAFVILRKRQRADATRSAGSCATTSPRRSARSRSPSR